MVEIAPFRGYRYNTEKVDLAKVVTPPYDVISPEMQEKFYERSEYNIARIIKGKVFEDDDENNNQYTRARDYFQRWIDEGILVQDDEEAIYIYSQEFEIAGNKRERTGFIALIKLEEFGKGVRPHEFTLSGPKADRLNLLRATKAHFGQIFSLYSDPERRIDRVLERFKNTPLVDIKDDEGIRHRLWKITDSNAIGMIRSEMAEKPLFIADGHHRYETALNYSKENEKARYCMMTFVNMQNEGLVILPTHRIIKNLEDFRVKKLEEGLRENFDIETFEFAEGNEVEMRETMLSLLRKRYLEGKHAFGMYCSNNKYYLLTLKSNELINRIPGPKALRKLDVTILHTLILEQLLGIDKARLEKGLNVEYIKDIGDAIEEGIRKVDSRSHQIIFFMNPTKVEEVQAVADRGGRMPQKSTFFYPKVYTGFVIYRVE